MVTPYPKDNNLQFYQTHFHETQPKILGKAHLNNPSARQKVAPKSGGWVSQRSNTLRVWCTKTEVIGLIEPSENTVGKSMTASEPAARARLQAGG
jgi:hypothetical protein